MFNESKSTTKPQTPVTTDKTQPAINMISPGTVINGSLSTKNDVRISGRVDGEVQADGKVILANDGYVNGNINAGEADVAGTVEGELNISDRLLLRQTARIKGDIQTKILLVEEGAVFEGACRMEGFPVKQNEFSKNSDFTKNELPKTDFSKNDSGKNGNGNKFSSAEVKPYQSKLQDTKSI